MANEFTYQMVGCEKVLPSGRKLLQPTWLSFFPDAKIGIIGHNGSGKSTLMKIMAGVDEDFGGEAFIAKAGSTVGYLQQEPELDESKTVKENIEAGMAEVKALLQRFEEVSEAFGDEDADFDKLCEEQARLQDQLDAVYGIFLFGPVERGAARRLGRPHLSSAVRWGASGDGA